MVLPSATPTKELATEAPVGKVHGPLSPDRYSPSTEPSKTLRAITRLASTLERYMPQPVALLTSVSVTVRSQLVPLA